MHFLLCPQTNDLAGVQLAEAVLEAVVILDVLVPVLKLIECGLEDLQYHLLWNWVLLHAGMEDKSIMNTEATFF